MNKFIKTIFGLLVILAVIGSVIPAQAGSNFADGPNLLVNPGFESPYAKQCCHTASTFPPNTPIDEVQVANGWRGWWREPSFPNYPPTCDGCTAWHRPEWREAAPFGNRIHGGANAQKYFTFFSVHEAGMYQQVSGIASGQRLRFSIYMHAWSTNGSSQTSTTKDNDMSLKVGIDPTGGADPFSSKIVWSAPTNVWDNWALFTVEAVAQGSTVTVYTYSKPRWGMEHNDVYVDDASLVVVGGSSTVATATPQPTSTTAATSVANITATTTKTPTSAPTTAASPTPSFQTYTVQRGDSLRSIARKFNTTVSAILALNSIPNPNVIFPGQVLKIPGASAVAPTTPPTGSSPATPPSGTLTTYTVQRGDTMYSIARKFGTTVSAIIAVNPGINPSRIFPGQVINMPFNNAGEKKTYVVQQGDNLRKIAAKFNTTIAILQQLNGLSDPNKIFVGQTLIVP
jgi:LysM repeat protein